MASSWTNRLAILERYPSLGAWTGGTGLAVADSIASGVAEVSVEPHAKADFYGGSVNARGPNPVDEINWAGRVRIGGRFETPDFVGGPSEAQGGPYLNSGRAQGVPAPGGLDAIPGTEPGLQAFGEVSIENYRPVSRPDLEELAGFFGEAAVEEYQPGLNPGLQGIDAQLAALEADDTALWMALGGLILLSGVGFWMTRRAAQRKPAPLRRRGRKRS